ncbi:MAG: Hsp20/alpha crystallin family protein [Candidatus Omnitrophota bacterium]|nr:Hsp20/alpha crystallin family protein [Candidatus Omnitrophota bacterium]
MTTKSKSDRKETDADRGDIGGGIFSSLTGFLENLGDLAEAGERLSRRQAANQDTGEKGRAGEKAGGENRFGRILSGLTDIAEKLNEISEKGETVTKKGEFTFPSKEGGVKGVYGFSLKTGLGGKDDQIRVEPFGNIRKDKKTGEAVVQEIHEPLIDVFEDEDATTLIAEMPGVGAEDIKIEVRDDVLTISAQKGEKKYRKEVLLGHGISKEKTSVTCNNGIVTIRCEKAG